MSAWDKLPTESARAYDMFCKYLTMGVDRSTRKLAQEHSKSIALIQKWSRVHKWQDRAAKYDDHIHQQAFKENQDALMEMYSRNIHAAGIMTEKSIEALKALNPEDMTPRDITAMLSKAIEIEGSARENIITELAKHVGLDDNKNISLAEFISLTYKEKRAGV